MYKKEINQNIMNHSNLNWEKQEKTQLIKFNNIIQKNQQLI